jgi:hypothetical protein
LFSVSDSDGDQIARYRIYDETAAANSGSFMINGIAQPAAMMIELTAAELASVTFKTGSGSDVLWFRANDGHDWGEWRFFTVTVPANHAPVVSASDRTLTRGANVSVSSLFSVWDADGDQMARYRIYDETMAANSGSFMINGIAQPAATMIELTAAELANVTFKTGSGSDVLWFRANDGYDWSEWRFFTASVAPAPMTSLSAIQNLLAAASPERDGGPRTGITTSLSLLANTAEVHLLGTGG